MRAVRASAERSIAVATSAVSSAIVPPAMQAVSRILAGCPASDSPPRNSTWSSAISTATSIACSTPTSGPMPPAAISSPSRSWRSRDTRPKTSCSAPPSWPAAARRSTSSRPGPVAWPRSSGSPRRNATWRTRRRCARTDACSGVYRKHLLPNYSVFDEQRYFVPSTVDGPLFVVAGVRVALTICEDAWSPNGPITTQAAGGAELVVNINASPFYAGRIQERETMLATRAADASVPVLYVNLVGGQDELVFDGASMMFDESGHLIARPVSSRKTCSSSTSTCGPRSAAGCSTPGAVAASVLPEVAVSEARLGEQPEAARRRAAAAAGAGGLRSAGAGHARLRAEERLHRRPHRDCRAASTRRWWRPSRSTRWARNRWSACSCRHGSRAMAVSPTPRNWRPTSGSAP